MEQIALFNFFATHVPMDGVTLSLLASLGTGVGAMPILFTSQLSEWWPPLLLSVGSGVMLSAAACSLLMPAWELAQAGMSPGLGLGAIAAAAAVGALCFYRIEQVLPQPDLEQNSQAQHIWLFIFAIALHHLPEGLAIGVSTASAHNTGLALGVALQNVPEGLMVALALRQLGYGVGFALTLATMSGWLEPLGGVLGVTLVGLGTNLAPISMASAAGAMLFVVFHELLPQIDLKTFNSSGSVGLVAGVVMMGMVERLLG
ncbi:MAG: ZIP family metal transporter [Symploca sp. SIO2G7]|nr:ZIP family metal transporter [Symploca sp. SIO2G7]